MSQIAVITQAYNAEKTIGRTVESVLAQTHTNFKYYLLDSASTDKTRNVINEYAKQDARIIPLHNDFNQLSAYMDKIPMMIDQSDEDGLFIMIDADDTYCPDAFEKLLKFKTEHNLDVAMAQYKAVSEETGLVTWDGRLKADVIHDRDNYAWYFPAYYSRIRTVWNKMISFDILKKCDFTVAKSLVYGADTAFVLEVLKHTRNFGMMADSLYNYYVSTGSISHKFMESRMMDGSNMFAIAHDFLATFSDVTQHNRNYLLHVYWNMIKASIQLMNEAEVDAEAKLTHLKTIINDPLTKEAFLLTDIPDIEKFNLIETLF